MALDLNKTGPFNALRLCKDKYLFNPFGAQKAMSVDPLSKEMAANHIMDLYYCHIVLSMSILIFSQYIEVIPNLENCLHGLVQALHAHVVAGEHAQNLANGHMEASLSKSCKGTGK